MEGVTPGEGGSYLVDPKTGKVQSCTRPSQQPPLLNRGFNDALKSRKRLLRAKIESSYGTDPTPAGTDAVLVRSLEITPLNADVVERELILLIWATLSSCWVQHVEIT